MDTADPANSWHEIKGPDQIEQLMNRFGRFHDGCIREIHVATGHSVGEDLSMDCDWRTTVHLLVQRQRPDPSAMELRFEEVIELHVSPPPPDYVSIIFAATFFSQDGIFYWSEDVRWSLESTQRDESTWIAARRVWWREASQWMGERLRYKSDQA